MSDLKYRVRQAEDGKGYNVTIERSKSDVLDSKPAKTMAEGVAIRDAAQAEGVESFADVGKKPASRAAKKKPARKKR